MIFSLGGLWLVGLFSEVWLFCWMFGVIGVDLILGGALSLLFWYLSLSVSVDLVCVRI